jgi:hypothetical protein
MFERDDWTLFRSVATLGQKAGVAVVLLDGLVAKELVDNALDAAGDARVGLLPGNGLYVEDDGDGIPGDDPQVADLFSINRPLRSTKLIRRPTRGALGNGLRVVAGAVVATGGSLTIATRGRILGVHIDEATGRAVAERLGDSPRPGTRIEVTLGSTLPVDEDALAWAEQAILLARPGTQYGGKSSPFWYDPDAFFELLHAAGERTVVEVVAELDGCAQPKAGKIAAEFRGRRAKDVTRDEAERLLLRARERAKPVRPDRLGALGPHVPGLPRHYAKAAGTVTLTAARGAVATELPYVVEVYAEVATRASVEVTVNRTPITAKIDVYHDAKKQDLSLFGANLNHAFKVGRRPLWLCINIMAAYLPITTDGKAPDLLPLLDLIGPAILRAGKRAGRAGGQTPAPAAISFKSVILDALDAAVAKASEGGTYRYSLRQLFYAVRPYAIEALGEEPKYDYFARVITDHEAALGQDLPGMYRDARGTLYHPHTQETIPLGTLAAEAYKRPAYTFNKILYCEKEGFFPNLIDAGFPERHDCALMTSKGFASRAARDVLDRLGDTAEELQVFCIHDGDAAGTMIFQSLQEETRSRPGRRVRIVNLGLEPAEATAMGLQVEPVKRQGGKAAPVADYVPPEWKEWLQGHRVELNAMPTGQFLAWLDAKMADYAGKVIPPPEVLRGRLVDEMRGRLRDMITAEVLEAADVDGRVEVAMEALAPAVRRRSKSLKSAVTAALKEQPTEPWSAPVAHVAGELIDRSGA